MKVEKKELDSTNMELKIILEKEEANKEFNNSVKYFRNKYQIPGFRKGKAPISMVKRMFKEAIQASFELSVADKYLKEALIKEKQNPINEPELQSSKWNNDEFEMVFKYEFMPEIKLKKYKDLEVEYPGEEYSDEMLNKQIEQIRKENATEQGIDENPQEGDFIALDFYKNEGDEEPIYSLENIYYSPVNFSEKMNEFFQNATIGDIIKTTFDIEPFDKDAVNIIDKDTEYYIKFEDAFKLILPELNDEFAKDLEFDSLADMREKLKEEILRQVEEKNRESKLTAIKVKLIQENPVDIPKTVVYDYSKELANSYVKSAKDLEAIIPMFNEMALFNIKSYFIRNEIIKKEKMELTEEDINKYIEIEADRFKITPEEYKKLYSQRINSESFKDEAFQMKYEDFLLENNKFILTKKTEPTKKEETEIKENKTEEKKEEK